MCKHLCSLRNKGEDLLSRLYGLSSKKKLLLLLLIWGLLFLPQAFHHSVALKDEHYQFFPEESAPEGFDSPGWDVETGPEPLPSEGERIQHEVSAGEQVKFRWIWHKDEDNSAHIGAVNVIYEKEGGEEGIIRLNENSTSETREEWVGQKEFEENANISYHYRVERGDIPIFQRRASIILEGGNPYEQTRTGPPPLIHLFFIPPTLLSAPVSLGGAFLSFNLYFALFLLLDSLLLYRCAAEIDSQKAILPAILFLGNPLTVFAFHQDEPIIAFLMLLPLYMLLKKRRYLSTSVGIGMIAKVWTGFWVPVMALLDGESVKKRIFHLAVSLGVAGGLLLIFRMLWGPKVLWFLSFYGGGASKSSLGGISFWAVVGKLFGRSLVPSTVYIVGVIGFMGLAVLYLSWEKGWRDVYVLVALLSVFFALYPKMHWEYFLVYFPPLLFIGIRERRYLILFYAVSVFASLSMILKHAGYGDFSLALSLLFSVMLVAILLGIVYFIYRDMGSTEDVFDPTQE